MDCVEEHITVLSEGDITGKVTPYGMDQVLNEKYMKATTAYKQFLEESQKDRDETKEELETVKSELLKESVMNDSLNREADVNQREMDQLEGVFDKYQEELKSMNAQYGDKLKELEEVRVKANEEIKRLRSEYGSVQADINVMLMETQKYECQVEFLLAENQMVVQAHNGAQQELDGRMEEEIVKDIEQNEEKRMQLEQEIASLNKEWFTYIDNICSETERVLSENELKEFRGRIAILGAELQDKQTQIQQITKEKQDIEKMIARSSRDSASSNENMMD